MKRKLVLLFAGLMAATCIACGEPTVAENTAESVQTEESQEQSSEETLETEAETEEEAGGFNIGGLVNSMDDEKPEVFSVPQPAEAPTLKDFFASKGLKAGTCLTSAMTSNPDMKNIVLEQFSSVTMENAMKPDAIINQKLSQEKGDIVVEFTGETARLLEFAKENGLAMRGHTLVWYSQTPSWIFTKDFTPKGELVDRDTMLNRMESYIKQVFTLLDEGGYSDMFYAYDVVNEAWMENGTMRDCYWKQIIGDDYLYYAFYYADKYAPQTIDLYYNDYNEQLKGNTFVKFVDTLKDKNGRYLIDGVGLQAHLYTSDGLSSYLRAVDTIAATGLKVQLTELDVCLGAYQKPLKASEFNMKLQGQFYYDLINGLLERIDAGTLKMDAITFWGFKDNLSWRSSQFPLLYDKNNKPKYAYYGALQMKDYAGFDQ